MKIIIIKTTIVFVLLLSVATISAQITMTTMKKEVAFGISGSGTAIINWGDGTPNETITLPDGSQREFQNEELRTIIIIGNEITGFYCDGNMITSLNVSMNTALTELNCSDNQLTSLDVTKNTALTYLGCSNNRLTSLDLTKNTALTILACSNNQITRPDVSKNTALKWLLICNNQLTSLDVSKNIALEWINCQSNNLSAHALNLLFGTLHGNVIPKMLEGDDKMVFITNNPGTASCNKSIAEKKRWEVETEFEEKCGD